MTQILAILFLLFTSPVLAATYHVSPNGTGTTCEEAEDPATPHNTIAEGVACLLNGSADILYLRAGTYTAGINLTVGSKAGAGSNYLTIAAFPGEIVTIAPTANMLVATSVNHHFIIDGPIFDGINTTTANVAASGIQLQNPRDFILRNIESKRMQYNGLFMKGVTNVLVEKSSFHDQRSQCATTGQNRFYGIYLETGTNVTFQGLDIYGNPGGGIHLNNGPINGVIVRDSKIHENNSCGGTTSPFGGIIAYQSAGAITGVQIYNNEVYLNGTTNETLAGGIQISAGVSGAKVFNNTVYNNQYYGIVVMEAAGTGNLVANNISLDNTLDNILIGPGRGTATTNIVSGNITDYVTSASNFTLKSGSTAISGGTAQTGFTYSDTVGRGAHDEWKCVSASIDTNVMDITCNTIDTPVLPASGMTGFSVACSGSGCGTPTVSTAERRSGSDTVIRLTISGITGDACAVGQTWTWSYAPGNVTNSALIGNQTNQPLLAASTQAVTEVCSGTPTTPPATGLHVDLPLDENTGTSAVDLEGNANGTLTGSTLPSWVAGKTGSALSFPNGTVESHLAIAYGNALDLAANSLSVCLGALVHDAGAAQKIVFSSDNGTNQRFYIGQIGGTWGIGIKSSGFSSGSEFPVVAEWTRLCLVANSGADVATLYVNGVKGTSAQVVKSYSGGLTLASNFKAGVGTFDVNYGGSTVDDIKIWAATALTDQEVLDDYTAWNPVAPVPTGTFVQKTFKFQGLRVDGSGNPVDLKAAGTNITVVPGGAFQVIIQTDCTTANCDPISQRLRFSRNGGTYTAIPDALAADNISFYQATADPDVVSAAVTCCLTGALTTNNGVTIFTSSAIPSIDLTQDSSVVERYVIKIGADATAGDTYDFRVYNQDGNALDTYTATPRVTVVDMSMGVGF